MSTASDESRSTHDGRLHCLVVTPERTLLDQHVDSVTLPLYDGQIGLLHGHSPVVGRLGFGELQIRRGAGIERYFVDGGFVQVRDDVVTVLTKQAMPTSEIQSEDARKELDSARSRVATTDGQAREKAEAVERARALLRLSSQGG